ncbi:hypothetical protein BDN72DRAFT_781767 [Pluteus cervinus]|uniref:Uncharacterized protein n=1 Tax=Pluteus cervinus TaxID=181527 RepID=A0ACD2ZZA4_9AGAR|nr:hypothetical protein BDN72DRAFT_781767 [Pluteus cervinus]
MLLPGEIYPDKSDRPGYSFGARHHGEWNRYGEKGHTAPPDLHPTQARKVGPKRVNFNQRLPYECKDSAKDPEECQLLSDMISPISEYLEEHLPALIPDVFSVWETYANSLPLASIPPAYPFTGLVLNLCVSTSAHKDINDESLCVVVPFGNKWTGGELCLFEPGLVVDLQPGDVIVFPSSQITHFNAHMNGERGSFVLYSDKKMGDWVKEANGWEDHIARH